MTKRVVVDASVVIKWFLPEAGAAAAASLLRDIRRGDILAVAPELVLVEAANVVWKRMMQGTISASDGDAIVHAIVESPLGIERTAPFVSVALAIAVETGCTVYDAMYVALALQVDGTLVTADSKLVRRMASSEYADRLRLLA